MLGDEFRPHLLRVGAVDGRQRGDRGRFVDRLDHPPSLDVGERLAGHPAHLGEPFTDLLGSGRQIVA